jgi:uncharacterized protein DUF4167
MKESYERYLALARTEAQNGNMVAAKNYYQHAEHYFTSMFSGSRAKSWTRLSEQFFRFDKWSLCRD